MTWQLDKLTDAELFAHTKARWGISKRAGHPVDLYGLVLDCKLEWERRDMVLRFEQAVMEEKAEDVHRDEINRKQ